MCNVDEVAWGNLIAYSSNVEKFLNADICFYKLNFQLIMLDLRMWVYCKTTCKRLLREVALTYVQYLLRPKYDPYISTLTVKLEKTTICVINKMPNR